MPLVQKIEADFKEALKSKNAEKVSCLRLLKAALKNRAIEIRGELADGETVKVLSSLAKQRRESIEQFQKAGRDDLVQKEKRELDWIQGYLPKALPCEEIEKLADEAIRETGAAGPGDMGKVMKALMPKVTGRADGKEVSGVVQKKLAAL